MRYGMDRAQKLAELITSSESGDKETALANVIGQQNKTLAEALVRQNAETLLRVQQMYSDVMARDHAFVTDVLNRQLAMMNVQAAQTHARFARATPVQRSVTVSSPGQKPSSSADSGLGSSTPGQSTDEDQTIDVADLDPFNVTGSRSSGFRPT